jgi:pyroglutamyl-peptidase
MKKVLVTGFEPFGGETINPALEAVKQLSGQTIAGYDVVTEEIPTVFRTSIEAVKAAIEKHRPSLVICVGQAGGRSSISVERVAINVDDARITDNEGYQPIDTPIIDDGPAAYFSTLPIKAIVKRLREAGIPAEVSQTAGTFVCNHVFYGVMHHLANFGGANDHTIRAGFIHIPYLPEQAAHHPGQPSMALETVVKGLTLAIEAAIEHETDIREMGGQIA